jgi:HlyD family secretion protein
MTVVARGTRTVGEVACTIPNADLKLLPNVNVSVKIITGEHANALILPREAVHQDEGRRYVYQVVGELQKRYIDTSLSNLTHVEVTSGVSQGALIALAADNSAPLREGLPVRVVQR